jgi:hypothetical protein
MISCQAIISRDIEKPESKNKDSAQTLITGTARREPPRIIRFFEKNGEL